MNLEEYRSIAEQFKRSFNAEPIMYRSPGRINVIGEHIDYNGGFVLPGAINQSVYFAVGKSESNFHSFVARDLGEKDKFMINGDGASKSWTRYFQNICAILTRKGFDIGGVNCVFGGDLPIGSGMSSSSSLTCGLLHVFNDLFGLNISKRELVDLASEAEHSSGLRGGKMDQFSIVFGKKNHLLYLNCKNLDYTEIPLNLTKHKLILFHSGVEHDLKSTGYNLRRIECEQSLETLQSLGHNFEYLADIPPSMIANLQSLLTPNQYKRAAFVIREQHRVIKAKSDLEQDNIQSLGKLMYESHYGLQNEYEVSCTELDFLVKRASLQKDIIGSRMMGGGFGGCTLNLIKKERADEVVNEMKQDYYDEYQLDLRVFDVELGSGLMRLN